jgi:hypothetical protein
MSLCINYPYSSNIGMSEGKSTGGSGEALDQSLVKMLPEVLRLAGL